MLELIMGMVGSGKSYEAVQRIAQDIETYGRDVYTNVSIDPVRFERWMHKRLGSTRLPIRKMVHILSDDEICRFWEHTDGNSLIVIDEAQGWFNARAWENQPPEMGVFLTQHRKWGNDIIIITQRIESIDAQMRRLCNCMTVIANLRQMGFGPFKLPFNISFIRTHDVDATTALPARYCFTSTWRWLRKRDWSVYNSYQHYEPIPIVRAARNFIKSVRQGDRATDKRSWGLRLGGWLVAHKMVTTIAVGVLLMLVARGVVGSVQEEVPGRNAERFGVQGRPALESTERVAVATGAKAVRVESTEVERIPGASVSVGRRGLSVESTAAAVETITYRVRGVVGKSALVGMDTVREGSQWEGLDVVSCLRGCVVLRSAAGVVLRVPIGGSLQRRGVTWRVLSSGESLEVRTVEGAGRSGSKAPTAASR